MKVDSNFEIRIHLDADIKIKDQVLALSHPQALSLSKAIARELQHAPAVRYSTARTQTAPKTGRKPRAKLFDYSVAEKLKFKAMRMKRSREGSKTATEDAHRYIRDLRAAASAEAANESVKKSRARLTDAKVRKIRVLRAGGTSRRELAERFGVSHFAIADIDNGKTWKHVQ